MRITRYEQRITISCSEHEFEILKLAVDQLDDKLPATGLRRSWSRRTTGGSFLRVDYDRRK